MAATDHTRLRSARADVLAKSTDNCRISPATPADVPSRVTPLCAPLLPPEAHTHPATNPLWVMRTPPAVPAQIQRLNEGVGAFGRNTSHSDDIPDAAPIAQGQGVPQGRFQGEERHSDESLQIVAGGRGTP